MQIEDVCIIQDRLKKIAKIVKDNVLNKDVWYDDQARDFATMSWNNQKGNHDEGIQSLYYINKIIVDLTNIVVAKMCSQILIMDTINDTAKKYDNIKAFKSGELVGVNIGGKTVEKITVRTLNNIGYIDISNYGEFPICENETNINNFIKRLQAYMQNIFDTANTMEKNITKNILNTNAVISFETGFNQTILKRKIQDIRRQLENIDNKLYIHMSAMVQETKKTINGLKTIYETDWTTNSPLRKDGWTQGNTANWIDDNTTNGWTQGNTANWIDDNTTNGWTPGNTANWIDDNTTSGWTQGNTANWIDDN